MLANCCCKKGCVVTFTVYGMFGLPAPSVTVTIGSTSQDTDSNGQVTFTLEPGTYTYTVTSPRFTTYTGSVTVNNDCTATGNTSHLSPASGYSPMNGCALPVANTLHVTDSVFGSYTLTHSGSDWVTNIAGASGGGYCSCASQPGALTVRMRVTPFGTLGAYKILAQWACDVDACPIPGDPTFGCALIGILSRFCPPELSMTLTYTTGSCVLADAFTKLIGPNTTITWVITE